MEPGELSPSEAARRIGTTTRSVQRWILSGRLPARRVGGRWRVASDALDAFLVAGRGLTPVEPARPGLAASLPGQPIRHVFVANRGEIARRIRRTGERLGIVVTVPATDTPGDLDLLDIAAVVAAAAASGADAVHPGFGFLAENAAFAEAVEAAALRWIGPPPSAIRAMGDKGAARRLAAGLGVPVIPGYDDDDQSDAALALAATSIGYPLLLKPAAGGGGKGMRVVRDGASLPGGIASARREAAAAFGDDRLVLERLLEGPSHVEIQVLFDAAGTGIHLGERDCSIQRRHQKVLEESPSPAVDDRLRRRLASHALTLAAAVGYVGAGTCEFLVTEDGDAYFLEMNTRLQVEHPVTELVTGRDLVADQIRIASGLPLGATQEEVDAARARGGHAVEARLYAEDAEAAFLPATGRIERLIWPSGPGIRIDAGVDEGLDVTGRFDPMLAKVIAHGADRSGALDLLAEALDRTVVLGLTTNLRFLRWLVRAPVVRTGGARVDTLDRIWPPPDWPSRTTIPAAAWGAAARALGAGGWRLNGPARVRLVADDESEAVADPGFHPGAARRVGPGARAATEPDTAPGMASSSGPEVTVVGGTAYVDVDGRSVAIQVAPPPDVDRAARAAVTHHAGGPVEVVAPMPGSVVDVHAATGDLVAAGDPLVTLEAMKMEHVVNAPVAGRVATLPVRPGEQVSRGQPLAIVEP
jgi:acetyl-CoA/propionyl-CoA carboxylase biotin carboxyl carrier protein